MLLADTVDASTWPQYHSSAVEGYDLHVCLFLLPHLFPLPEGIEIGCDRDVSCRLSVVLVGLVSFRTILDLVVDPVRFRVVTCHGHVSHAQIAHRKVHGAILTRGLVHLSHLLDFVSG